jgi:uncharacterized protein (DUF934 family)
MEKPPMALLKNGQIVADGWRRIGDDEPLPDSGPVIVSLARWQREREALDARANEARGSIGLVLNSDQGPASIADDLTHFDLVALDFPRFQDGRAYSYARLLRERYKFTGELRAVGNVLRDQLLFMRRTGFDAFELPETANVREWLKAFEDFSVFYQRATDKARAAAELRDRRPNRKPEKAEAVAGVWSY